MRGGKLEISCSYVVVCVCLSLRMWPVFASSLDCVEMDYGRNHGRCCGDVECIYQSIIYNYYYSHLFLQLVRPYDLPPVYPTNIHQHQHPIFRPSPPLVLLLSIHFNCIPPIHLCIPLHMQQDPKSVATSEKEIKQKITKNHKFVVPEKDGYIIKKTHARTHRHTDT
jgi:hypothetical protein